MMEQFCILIVVVVTESNHGIKIKFINSTKVIVLWWRMVSGSEEKQEQFKVEFGLTSHWFGYLGQIFNVLNLSYHFTDEKNVAHRN